MSERAEHGLSAGAAVGGGLLLLCCFLPAVAGLSALALGLIFGLGSGAVALAIGAVWLVRRRRDRCAPASSNTPPSTSPEVHPPGARPR